MTVSNGIILIYFRENRTLFGNCNVTLVIFFSSSKVPTYVEKKSCIMPQYWVWGVMPSIYNLGILTPPATSVSKGNILSYFPENRRLFGNCNVTWVILFFHLKYLYM